MASGDRGRPHVTLWIAGIGFVALGILIGFVALTAPKKRGRHLPDVEYCRFCGRDAHGNGPCYLP